ncbi:MAG: hypothetical protein JWN75_84 [Candidatus Saccharibacteria bacterium]|nr:hypothetical protein [Candidatus Saccharibacteria bacterium]
MPNLRSPSIITRLTDNLGAVTLRRRSVIEFARRHKLIYFRSVKHNNSSAPVIRSSTTAVGQVDTNFCVGTHAGYDLALVERLANVGFGEYKTTIHRWYVLQIDLKSASNLPFIFVGTKQQTKAYYAKLLTAHRELRYMAVDGSSKSSKDFHSHYAVLSSPAHTPTLYRFLNNDMIEMIAGHKYPFALEIQDDVLYVITEATKPNQQLLDKLLHYGLWVAKEIDQRLK